MFTGCQCFITVSYQDPRKIKMIISRFCTSQFFPQAHSICSNIERVDRRAYKLITSARNLNSTCDYLCAHMQLRYHDLIVPATPYPTQWVISVVPKGVPGWHSCKHTPLVIVLLHSCFHQTTKRRLLSLYPGSKGSLIAWQVESTYVPCKKHCHNFLLEAFSGVPCLSAKIKSLVRTTLPQFCFWPEPVACFLLRNGSVIDCFFFPSALLSNIFPSSISLSFSSFISSSTSSSMPCKGLHKFSNCLRQTLQAFV